jgi:hypothetical protein
MTAGAAIVSIEREVRAGVTAHGQPSVARARAVLTARRCGVASTLIAARAAVVAVSREVAAGGATQRLTRRAAARARGADLIARTLIAARATIVAVGLEVDAAAVAQARSRRAEARAADALLARAARVTAAAAVQRVVLQVLTRTAARDFSGGARGDTRAVRTDLATRTRDSAAATVLYIVTEPHAAIAAVCRAIGALALAVETVGAVATDVAARAAVVGVELRDGAGISALRLTGEAVVATTEAAADLIGTALRATRAAVARVIA